MARATHNIASANIIEALKIEGYPVKEARRIVDLARRVAMLQSNQTIIKASELTEEHVGLLLKIGKLGETRLINDVDETGRSRGMQFGYMRQLGTERYAQVAEGEFDDDIPTPPRNHRAVTVVLDSKLVKIPWNTLVTLTDASAD